MENSKDSKTLAYSSFGTFLTTLDHYGDVGIPNLVDRTTVPPTLSGSSKYEVLGTLRFFGLTGDGGKPNTELFQRLMGEKRRETMVELLQERYPGLFALPLASAGPSEIDKWFRENATPSTVGRAKAFFLSAAKQNGIPLHPLVAKGTRAVTGGIKRKRRKAASKVGETGLSGRTEEFSGNGSSEQSGHGMTKSVELRSGSGSVTLRVGVDLWGLEGDDRLFVFGLIDALKTYEKGESPAINRAPGAAES